MNSVLCVGMVSGIMAADIFQRMGHCVFLREGEQPNAYFGDSTWGIGSGSAGCP